MNKAISLGILPLLFLALPSTGSASSWHVGYDIGQMAFNEFKYVAGEVGYSFENDHALRLAVFNVALSERHLSSNEASAVEGDNVEGLWRGVDLYYDFAVTKSIIISPRIGYYDIAFTHTVLGTSLARPTLIAGFALSYLENDILGLKNVYARTSLTFGYDLKDKDDAILGDSIVSGDSFSFVPAFFIGYNFK